MKKYSHLHPDPKVIENCRIAQVEFGAELGIKPGVSVTKEEYVRNYASIAPVEIAKVRHGEGSIMHNVVNRIIDVVDKDHDGTVSKERFRELAVATGVWDLDHFDALFDLLDNNKTGKLERKELCDYYYKVYFTLEDVTS